MARSKDELKAYITDLCKEKNFNAEQTAIAVAAATGDAAALQGVDAAAIAAATAPLLDLAVGRQSDYSRAMNEANSEKAKASAHFQKLEAWRIQTVLPEVQKLKDTVARYESKGISLNDPNDDDDDDAANNNAAGRGKGKNNVEPLNADDLKGAMARDFLAFESERAELEQLYFDAFKRPLDTRPLIKTIGDAAADPTQPRQISLRDAFNIVHGPKLQEISDKARADELAAAEKRGEEKGRRAAVTANASRTGAAVPAGTGAFWDAISRDQKQSDADKLSPADRASLFGADLRAELERSEQEFEKSIS